jgi:hypothetical protein
MRKPDKQTSQAPSGERSSAKRLDAQSLERWLEVACECEKRGNTLLAMRCLAQAELLDQKTKES